MNKIALLCFILLSVFSLSNSKEPDLLQSIDYTKTPYLIRIQCNLVYDALSGETTFLNSFGILVTAEYVLVSSLTHHQITYACEERAYFIAGTTSLYRDNQPMAFPSSGQKRHHSSVKKLPLYQVHLVKMEKPFNLTDNVNIANFTPTKDYILRPDCRQVFLLHIEQGFLSSGYNLYSVTKNLTSENCKGCKDDPLVACYGRIEGKQTPCYGDVGMPVECNGFVAAIKQTPPPLSCKTGFDLPKETTCQKLTVIEYYYTDIEKVTGRKMPFQRSVRDARKNEEDTTTSYKARAENRKIRAQTFMAVIISVLCLFCNINNLYL